MRVHLLQYDIVWEDKAANHRQIAARLAELQPGPGDVVVLPEMSDTGFSFALDQIVDSASEIWASGVARQYGIWLSAGDALRGPDGRGRNRASLFGPGGERVAEYHKVFPFSFGRESEFFSGGDGLVLRRIGPPGRELIACPLVCYDLRFPELFRLATAAGAECFLIGANWPAPRTEHWRTMLIARAIENQAFVVGVNRCGRDPHLPYAGGSIAIAPDGTILAEAGSDAESLTVDLDPAALTAWRTTFPALADLRPDLLGRIDIDGPVAEP
ncbi:MAG: nitrilase-related carbon-nitrogen hydrolase [Phycisphaerales bacterium]